MSALEEFLGIRRVVALWESRVDTELGGVHGLGLSDFAALYHLAEAPSGRLRRVDSRAAPCAHPVGGNAPARTARAPRNRRTRSRRQ